MNKNNIVIGLLIIIIAILGYQMTKSSAGLQEAATVKSQPTISIDKELQEGISAITAKNGTLTPYTQAQSDSILNFAKTIGTQSSGANRIYTCTLYSGGGSYSYQYSSIWDQGGEWWPTVHTRCKAN